MKRLDYHRLDVFTDRAFGGNPLAVFTDGLGLSTEVMQSIANELNISETTFVLPPGDKSCDCRVRIFTPRSELPMAGHPTVGTAYVLTRAGIFSKPELIFEEGIGPVPVTVELKDGAPGFIEMQQPVPKFGPRVEDVGAVAEMLSLPREAIREFPCELVSCGNPFFFVPVASLEAMRSIRFRVDVAERVLSGIGATGVFPFSTEVEFPGSGVHGRLFAPGQGIGEDPATGSAAGPLGGYLVRYGVMPSTGELRCVLEQGIEMGRPSFLHIAIKHRAEEITETRVGGTCRYMGEGYFNVD